MASRFGLLHRIIFTSFLLCPTLTFGDGVMPTLNVQLRFLCLSLADSPDGVIEVVPLADLPSTPSTDSLGITTRWNTRTSSALSTITSGPGIVMNVNEKISDEESCRKLPRDSFIFSDTGSGFRSDFCISGASQEKIKLLEVHMLIHGRSKGPAALFLNRINAVASCYPSRALNAIYDGVKIDRELIRLVKK